MKYPKYITTADGYIGVFQYLEFGEFPVYRFEGGEHADIFGEEAIEGDFPPLLRLQVDSQAA